MQNIGAKCRRAISVFKIENFGVAVGSALSNTTNLSCHVTDLHNAQRDNWVLYLEICPKPRMYKISQLHVDRCKCCQLRWTLTMINVRRLSEANYSQGKCLFWRYPHYLSAQSIGDESRVASVPKRAQSVEPFWYNSDLWQTDRQTDRQTQGHS